MRRREFIKVIAGSAAAWPLAAFAQQADKMPVVGFINAAAEQDYQRQVAAFLNGLREAGYIDGQNVTIEYRWANEQIDRLPALVADLVQRRVTVIAATTTAAALAAKAVTTAIPIIFELGADPVKVGLVSSLSRPGGNITGVTQSNVEMAPKRLQLLHELLPNARVIALLVNADLKVSAETNTQEVSEAARGFGIELHVLAVNRENEIESAFAQAVQTHSEGLIVGSGAFFASHTKKLAQLAAQYAIPTIYQFREFAAAGGLMSYGSHLEEAYRLAGIYAGRVLKGDKPADLPVQQATKVELIINLKAAKALGVTIPNTLIGRADEVIE
jgi:putative tryptophan/tyrosine transport system substrate-binding protein